MEDKLWGFACRLYEDPWCELMRVHPVKGGHSSIHKHSTKHNQFIVLSGCLQLNRYNEDGSDLGDPVFLHEGQSAIVPAGVWHRFLAVEESVAIELYTQAGPGVVVRPGEADIQRKDSGGVRAAAAESER